MTDESQLIADLREAGHEDAAQRVQDSVLARQLREAGHDELAASLAGEQQRTPQTPAETAAAALAAAEAHRQQEAEDFVQGLKDKTRSAWTSTSGLLE